MTRTCRSTRPGRPGAAVAILLVLGAGVLTGCGGTSEGTGAAPAPATTAAAAPSGPTSTAPPATPVEPDPSGTPAPSAAPSAAPAAPAAPTSPAAAAPAAITVDDFAYQVPGTVAAGATVEVVNSDVEAHTLTATGAGGFAVTVPVGGTGTFVAPGAPGSYPFVCRLHGGMEGVLVVG